MPNFCCQELAEFKPVNVGQLSFLGASEPKRGRSLVLTRLNASSPLGFEFLLEIVQRPNYLVVRGEKSSKAPSLYALQSALFAFSKLFAKGILSSNIRPDPKASILLPLNVKELLDFSPDFLEIGFGKGEHLSHFAAQNPDKKVLGLDIYGPGLRRVLKSPLNNLKVCDLDARILLELLPSQSLQGLFMFFPIPWNKSKTRRVLNQAVALDIARILGQDAFFHLRTDDEEYFHDACSLFKELGFLDLSPRKLEVISKYERRWLSLGKRIFDMSFRPKPLLRKLKSSSWQIDEPKKRLKEFFYKDDSCFLKLQDIYEIELEGEKVKLLKLSFGDFCSPSNGFLLLSKPLRFLGEKPPNTRSISRALNTLNDFLQGLK